MILYLCIVTGGEFNSEQKLNFSRPGRPPKRFLPPQFSSTPPLLSSSQVSTPTNTSKQVKPAYEGESNEIFFIFKLCKGYSFNYIEHTIFEIFGQFSIF